MIFKLFLLCVFATLAYGRYHHHHHHHHHPTFYHLFKSSFEKCFNDSRINEEEFAQWRHSHNPQAHCILACALGAEKIMNLDGHFDHAEVIEKIKVPIFSEFDSESVTEVLHTCLSIAKSVEDKCEKAHLFAKCIHRGYHDLEREHHALHMKHVKKEEEPQQQQQTQQPQQQPQQTQ